MGVPVLARFRSGDSAAATPPPSLPADGPAAFASPVTSSITADSSLRTQPAPASASAGTASCGERALKVSLPSPSGSPAQDGGNIGQFIFLTEPISSVV
jgi:hypothetical protein